jgi:hypothetical protein
MCRDATYDHLRIVRSSVPSLAIRRSPRTDLHDLAIYPRRDRDVAVGKVFVPARIANLEHPDGPDLAHQRAEAADGGGISSLVRLRALFEPLPRHLGSAADRGWQSSGELIGHEGADIPLLLRAGPVRVGAAFNLKVDDLSASAAAEKRGLRHVLLAARGLNKRLPSAHRPAGRQKRLATVARWTAIPFSE